MDKKNGKGKYLLKNGDYVEGIWSDDSIKEKSKAKYAY